MVKKCTKCKLYKPLLFFIEEPLSVRKDGYYPSCKTCKAEYDRQYRIKNKETIRKNKQEYHILNAQRLNEKSRRYAIENWESILKYKQKWSKKKKEEDINYRISCILRTRLSKAIKGNFKSGSAVYDLGCSIEFFKQYLESKFQSGMTWAMWAQDGWHLDHIRPLCSFDLTDYGQFKQAAHYTNLQPLWAEDHVEKTKKDIKIS